MSRCRLLPMRSENLYLNVDHLYRGALNLTGGTKRARAPILYRMTVRKRNGQVSWGAR